MAPAHPATAGPPRRALSLLLRKVPQVSCGLAHPTHKDALLKLGCQRPSILVTDTEFDTEGIRASAGRAHWISSPTPSVFCHVLGIHTDTTCIAACRCHVPLLPPSVFFLPAVASPCPTLPTANALLRGASSARARATSRSDFLTGRHSLLHRF